MFAGGNYTPAFWGLPYLGFVSMTGFFFCLTNKTVHNITFVKPKTFGAKIYKFQEIKLGVQNFKAENKYIFKDYLNFNYYWEKQF